MDYKSLTSLMLRLTGVIITVSAITAMPRTFINLHVRNPPESPDVAALLLTIVASGLPILVGLLLIYFPATVANKIVSAVGESVDTLNLQQLAFSVLGLYFASLALFECGLLACQAEDLLRPLQRVQLRSTSSPDAGRFCGHSDDLCPVRRRHSPVAWWTWPCQSGAPAAKPAALGIATVIVPKSSPTSAQQGA
ncbi:MAG TPA: hypothetical protein VKC66_31260 [Xanthobacteraceae bacterium]|nr:hypothetical protein [Xanthobacteraceae bacterium]